MAVWLLWGRGFPGPAYVTRDRLRAQRSAFWDSYSPFKGV